jgi:hypothetical protein
VPFAFGRVFPGQELVDDYSDQCQFLRTPRADRRISCIALFLAMNLDVIAYSLGQVD